MVNKTQKSNRYQLTSYEFNKSYQAIMYYLESYVLFLICFLKLKIARHVF